MTLRRRILQIIPAPDDLWIGIGPHDLASRQGVPARWVRADCLLLMEEKGEGEELDTYVEVAVFDEGLILPENPIHYDESTETVYCTYRGDPMAMPNGDDDIPC